MRAKRKEYIPVVLSREEIDEVLSHLAVLDRVDVLSGNRCRDGRSIEAEKEEFAVLDQ